VNLPFWSASVRSASAWFARLRSEDVALSQQARFQRWLEADPRNAARYEHQEVVWDLAAGLEHDPEIEQWLEAIETAPSAAATPAFSGRRLTFAALACALALLAIGLSVHFMRGSVSEQLYATAIGEERTIALPDHSTMTLNTATRVRVSYSGSRRTVLLERGETTFNVVHDATRSFEVVAAGGTARAL